jgi:dipeptide transport system ATP-binding protein
VVGESGSGKSTLARIATLLEPPTAGVLRLEGAPTASGDAQTKRRQRLAVQMVFQNPYGSLNPRKTLGASLVEPLTINHIGTPASREAMARSMMEKVGLRPEQFARYPHQFSGGQRQRIAIARALMLRARIVVADEPASALDVSIQAQVLNLMMDLQDSFGVAYLFISHDLSVVRHIAHEVLVLYCGRPVEYAEKTQIFTAPRHPYTRILLAATPSIDPARRGNKPSDLAVQGEMPSPLAPPPGCAFASRCPRADALCTTERPEFQDGVACHHPYL